METNCTLFPRLYATCVYCTTNNIAPTNAKIEGDVPRCCQAIVPNMESNIASYHPLSHTYMRRTSMYTMYIVHSEYECAIDKMHTKRFYTRGSGRRNEGKQCRLK